MKPFDPTDKLWQDRYSFERLMFITALARSGDVDAFSTWVLGVTGAVGVLVLANLDKLNSILRSGWQWWFVVPFSISALSGLWQRFQAMRAQYARDVEQKIFTDGPNVEISIAAKLFPGLQPGQSLSLEQLTEFRETVLGIAEEAKNEFKKATPSFARKEIDKGFEAGKQNALYGLRLGTKWFFSQFKMTILQVLALGVQICALPCLIK
jgi:hypothetical protein